MKELGTGIVVLIGAILVTVIVYWFLFIYSMFYSVWLTISLKNWKAFFLFWWRLIDGLFAAVGHCLFQIGYALDLSWNVTGEAVEDFVTHEEKTEFSKKNITLSASIGKLSIDGKLNNFGKKFSSFLNVAFNQKAHAEDSWNYHTARMKLLDEYFK